MSATNPRRRESVNGLASPAAKVHNRFRTAVVSVVPAMRPASFLGCNTKERRRFRSHCQHRPNWVNSRPRTIDTRAASDYHPVPFPTCGCELAMRQIVNVNPTTEHGIYLRLFVSNGPGL